MSSYRENASATGITELPVMIPPPTIAAFWIISDGSVYFKHEGPAGLTMEAEEATRFTSKEKAVASLSRAGVTAQRTLHVLRVDCSATVTDETFAERDNK